jgi:hypothetical protein
LDRRTELEQLFDWIDEDPDYADIFLVLAVLLGEQGDPRGELIMLQHAHADPSPREQELVALLDAPHFADDVEWSRGFIRHVDVQLGDASEDEYLVEFLAHPSARHLVSIDWRRSCGVEIDLGDPVLLLTRAPCHRALRKVKIEQRMGIDEYAMEPVRGEVDLSPLWDASPFLRAIIVGARHITLGSPVGPLLQEVELDGEVRGEELARLVERAVDLKRLVIEDLTEPGRFWTALTSRPPLAMEHLYVAGDEIDEEIAALVCGAASAFGRLKELTLPYVADEVVQRIRAALPAVKFAKKRPYDPYEEIMDPS